jgi:hypothetical protein
LAGDAYPFAQGLLLIPALVGLALLLLSPNKAGGVPKRFFPVLLLPWALLCWSLLSLFWAPDPGQGVRESIVLLGNLTVFTLVFLLMLEDKEFSTGSALIPGLVLIPVLSSAIYQRMFGLTRTRETLLFMENSGDDVAHLAQIITQNRVFAGFLNPNMLAGFLAVGICLTLDLLLTTPDRRRFYFFTFLTGAQCAVLVLTGSIGGSLAAVVMAGTVLLVRRKFRLKEIAFAGGVIVLIGAGLLAIRGGGFLLGPESSLVQRGGYMAAGVRMALIHPLLGWGAGSSPGALMGFVAEGIRPVADPHNFLVRAWISWGLPGLFLLMGFLTLWFHAGIRFFASRGWRKVPMGYAGFIFGGTAFLMHSMLDMDFFVPETALLGWCVLGAALGLAAAHEQDDGTGAARPRNGLTLAMGAAALVLVLPVFVFLQGESLAFRAGKAASEGDTETAVRLYQDARVLLPMSGRFALNEGRARYAAGDVDLANELFRKADSLMLASPYPSREMGRIALAQKQWEGAVVHLENALARYPTSPRIRLDLAQAFYQMSRYEEAIRLLQEVARFAIFDREAMAGARKALEVPDPQAK